MRPRQVPSPAAAADPRTLRIIGLAMAGGVALFSAVAIGLGFARESPPDPPGTLAWALCGIAIVTLAAGWTIPGDAAPRRMVSLALREAAGLLGAVITILTGSGTWAAALGLLSVASILAGVAAAGAPSAGPSANRHPGGRRLG